MTEPFSSPEIEFDRYGRYLLPRPGEGGGKLHPFTRVTTFAKTVSDTFALSQWSQRMAVKGVAMRPDLYALAKSIPLSDRKGLNALVESAKTAAEADSGANYGNALHTFTEVYDETGENTAQEPWHADVEAYASALKLHGIRPIKGLSERVILNTDYDVAGRFDRIVEYRGESYVFDVKTGKDLSYGWGEISIQLALYANASHMLEPDNRTWSLMPRVNPDVGLVIHLPQGKANAQVYWVDLQQGYRAADLCAQARAWRRQRGLAGPLQNLVEVTVETVPPRKHQREIGSGQSWKARLATSSSRDQLSAIWKEASDLGEWTPELHALGRQRLAELEAGA